MSTMQLQHSHVWALLCNAALCVYKTVRNRQKPVLRRLALTRTCTTTGCGSCELESRTCPWNVNNVGAAAAYMGRLKLADGALAAGMYSRDVTSANKPTCEARVAMIAISWSWGLIAHDIKTILYTVRSKNRIRSYRQGPNPSQRTPLGGPNQTIIVQAASAKAIGVSLLSAGYIAAKSRTRVCV